jgi:hypothetical protein
MNTIAERYVKLVLAVGQTRPPTMVAAFYGPAVWRPKRSGGKVAVARESTRPAHATGSPTSPALTDADRRDELATLQAGVT